MISIIIDIKGTDLQIGNLYPIDYLSMISEGLGNNQSVVTLVRGGWAGHNAMELCYGQEILILALKLS